MDTIYLEGQWEGWIINPLQDGIQIISPGCGELEIEQTNLNTVDIIEQPNAEADRPAKAGERGEI